jgi:hypothetical protein
MAVVTLKAIRRIRPQHTTLFAGKRTGLGMPIRGLNRVTARALRCAALMLVLMLGCSLAPGGATAADGVWKETVTQEFDPASSGSVKRVYRAWDFHPELNLEFDWSPDVDDPSASRDGPIEGKGKLTWRVQGTERFDPNAVHSEYTGLMKNGRPEGQGTLVLRAGTIYVGAWKNGLMEGRGSIKFENGDNYEGDFVAGLMEGRGRYGSADGTIYVGELKAGQRDGVGELTLPDGSVFKTTWRAGRQVAQELVSAGTPGGPLPIGRTSSGLTLRLMIDRKTNQKFLSEGEIIDSYVYEANDAPGAMKVELASEKLVAVWKGDGRLDAKSAEYFEEQAQFGPVYLVADISNDGNRSTRINSAYLSVDESATDLQPYLVISGSSGNVGACMIVPSYDPVVKFQNYGWGAVRNAQLTFTFGNATSRTGEFKTALGTFDATKSALVVDALQKSKLNIAKMRASKFKCASVEELPSCLKSVEASGLLGDLAGRVALEAVNQVVTNAAGRIDYEWGGSDGQVHARTSPIALDIPLFKFEIGSPECGGGGPVEHGGRKLELPLDKRGYRLPVNWRADLAPRENKRFAFSLAAAKSSHHVFRLVLELADGTMLGSRQVDLSYFKPRLPARR